MTPRHDEHDEISVTLRIGDWVRIRNELRDDADAEVAGPAATALLVGEADTDEEMIQRAEAHDRDATYCHESGSGTRRCADVIEQALREEGWTE
jgi:hypothetical protein